MTARCGSRTPGFTIGSCCGWADGSTSRPVSGPPCRAGLGRGRATGFEEHLAPRPEPGADRAAARDDREPAGGRRHRGLPGRARRDGLERSVPFPNSGLRVEPPPKGGPEDAGAARLPERRDAAAVAGRELRGDPGRVDSRRVAPAARTADRPSGRGPAAARRGASTSSAGRAAPRFVSAAEGWLAAGSRSTPVNRASTCPRC